MDTELLPVIEGEPGARFPLVPTLCGVVIASSWAAVCLAMVPWLPA